MAVTEEDIAKINRQLQGVLGQQAWGVALGVGSFITLEFGESVPPRRQGGRVHGEWHLWVCACAWRLEAKNDVMVGSDDSREKLEPAVRQLEGRTLQSIVLSPPAPDAVFTFSEGFVLRLFPFLFSDDDEHWMLFTPGSNVLTIGPAASWSYGSAEAPR
jgi:hypothetical protein